MPPAYASVAFPLPLKATFTYRVPAAWGAPPPVGARVTAPFGRRHLTGLVVETCELPPAGLDPASIRDLEQALDTTPALDAGLLRLVRWLADYYRASLGMAAATALPPASARERSERVVSWSGGPDVVLRGARARALAVWLREAGPQPMEALRERFGEGAAATVRTLEARGLVQVEARRRFRDPFGGQSPAPDVPPALTAAQERVYQEVGAALGGGFSAHLLHGITGSGKTEVYLRLIARVLEAGQGALVLVPEIALTPQLSARFRARFGDRVAVLHSGLSGGERLDQWERLRAGERSVVVGARSAVFAPVNRLGLIVVDEEHDASYKQGDGVRYSGRDVALVRGQFTPCPVVLGSATPSLESLSNAWRGRSRLHTLAERPTGASLPEVRLIDLRSAPLVEAAPCLSLEMKVALDDCLARGRQAILYHNRRGHSPFQLCLRCGYVPECPDCAIALTWHLSTRRLECHTCGRVAALPRRCPACASEELELRGLGTERVEEELAAAFPGVSVARFDSDSVGARGHSRVLEDFAQGRHPILVGTQMITKGHDFPNVHLVGVLLAEHGLKFPDFRAAEHTVQRLVQVAGRAGRSGERGLVLVQTYTPEHYALPFLASHDYLGFAVREAALREQRGFPPATHLALLELKGRNPLLVEQDLTGVRDLLAAIVRAHQWAGVRLLGPVPAAFARVRGDARFHLLTASRSRQVLRDLLAELDTHPDLPQGLYTDVDPVDLL
jgi:primosomal protein N' (replication factor Y)